MSKRKRAPRAPTRSEILALAAEAGVDPRTIVKVLKGEAVRGMSGERARMAIDRAQFDAIAAAAVRGA